MKTEIVLANLRQRPVRTTVSLLAVAIEVMLILAVVGLATGMSTETGKRIEGVGADIMFQPPNSSVFLALNSAAMPISIRDKLLEVEGVKAVAPVLTQINSGDGRMPSLDIVYGIDWESFYTVSGGFIFHAGEPFSRPEEVIVDDWYARSQQVEVGDEISLLNHTFRVSGIVEHGKGARIFLPLESVQELTGSIDRASMFFVKCDNPDETYEVISRLEESFPTYPARPLREYVSLMTSTNLPVVDAFIQAVVLLAVSIGVLVIFLSMYTTITERTREIGILRSLGASKSFVALVILQESAFVCLVGTMIGIGLSFLAARLISVAFPTLVVIIPLGWVARASLFAILSGILGGLYPSLKAAGQDPVEALAYE